MKEGQPKKRFRGVVLGLGHWKVQFESQGDKVVEKKSRRRWEEDHAKSERRSG